MKRFCFRLASMPLLLAVVVFVFSASDAQAEHRRYSRGYGYGGYGYGGYRVPYRNDYHGYWRDQGYGFQHNYGGSYYGGGYGGRSQYGYQRRYYRGR